MPEPKGGQQDDGRWGAFLRRAQCMNTDYFQNSHSSLALNLFKIYSKNNQNIIIFLLFLYFPWVFLMVHSDLCLIGRFDLISHPRSSSILQQQPYGNSKFAAGLGERWGCGRQWRISCKYKGWMIHENTHSENLFTNILKWLSFCNNTENSQELGRAFNLLKKLSRGS